METTQKTVTISEANALEAYKQADEQLKPVLAKLLGLNQAPETWEDIKTFEAACLIAPPTDDENYILNHPGKSNAAKASVAHTKMAIVSRAMNKLHNGGKEWNPDWSDSNEYKYYPWLKYVAGSGFSDFDCNCDYAITGVGSRLCFRTSAIARHAAVQFKDLYNDLFTL